MDFLQSKLHGLSSKKHLAELLGVDVKELKEVEKHFTASPFEELKNGKVRTFYNPHPRYKLVLKRLNNLLSQIIPPTYVLGGIKERNYAMNGSAHKENQFFMLLDIENFFPSTRDSYIYHFFRIRLSMDKDLAKICTLLTTVSVQDQPSQRHLPQGFPTSPILSYLGYYDMYNRINNLALSKGISFSCYYDDLTFSAPHFIPKSFKKQISSIVNEYNLTINHRKTRLLKNRTGVRITGAIVKESSLSAPNQLQKKLMGKFQALKELFERNPSETDQVIELCNSVQGCLSAIQTVEKGRRFSYMSSEVSRIRKAIKTSRNKKASKV